MFQVYFCIGTVIFSIALTTGLISGIYYLPPETHTDQEIYQFAGKVMVYIALLICGMIFLLTKTGHIRINKNLVENKEEAKDEKE